MRLDSTSLLSPIAFLALAAVAGAQTVRDEQRLNTTGFNPNGNNRIDGAVIAVRGTTFYAAWTEQFGSTEFTQDIYFARSTDDGATWSTPVRIDTGEAANANDSELPKIAVSDSGAVVCIWEEQRDAFAQQSTTDDIFYNRSADGGLTWLPAALPLNVATAGAHVASDIDRAWLSASGNTFHVTWEEDSVAGLTGDEELQYTRSTDGGATWSMPVILSANPGANDVDEPKVEADGNLVVITYVDAADDVIAHRSTDGGATWSGPVQIESDQSGNADEPILEVAHGTVAVAWTEADPGGPGGEGVKAAISNDGGVTWRPEVLLSVRQVAQISADADSPKVAIQSAGSIFVVYDEDSVHVGGGGATGSSNNECLVGFTNDGGATWTTDRPLWPGVIANRPYVVATSSAVVVWLEQNANGSNRAAFCYSLDSGASWTLPEVVQTTGPDVDEGTARDEGVYVAMSAESNTVMAVHMDRPTGANEVYTSGYLLDVNIGTNYCQAVPNSTGLAAEMRADGSVFVIDNDFALEARQLPLNAFGYFLASRTQGFIQNPGSSQGNLCLGGGIGRFVLQVANSGSTGRIRIQTDLAAFPQPSGMPVTVLAGEVWSFTAWYRDQVGPLVTSNFADGLEVTFR